MQIFIIVRYWQANHSLIQKFSYFGGERNRWLAGMQAFLFRLVVTNPHAYEKIYNPLADMYGEYLSKGTRQQNSLGCQTEDVRI